MKLKVTSNPRRFVRRNRGIIAKSVAGYFEPWRSVVSKLRSIDADFEARVATEAGKWANQRFKALMSGLVVQAGSEMSRRIESARRKSWMISTKDFDPVTERLVQFLDTEAAYYEVEFSAGMIESLRRVLVEASANGWSIGVTERALREFVDLTEKQAASLARQVSSVLESELAAGSSPGVANIAAEKFAAWRGQHMRMLRRETIARTETARAYGFGQQESVRQAMDAGIVTRAMKVWRTSGDDRVREAHVFMEGEAVPVDQPFSNGSMYPDDINERCYVDYEIEVV